MKNTCVNITGKLPAGLVALYVDVQKHARALDIDFLAVGAMARDLVLVHGFGAEIERDTKDVDFGINVANWDAFSALRDSLLQAGYEQDVRKIHRLICEDKADLPWEIDIIPFGKVTDENNRIHWPPKQDFVMNVHGFLEAFEYALEVQISEAPDVIIPVASPAGTCLLKLVSWLDREAELRAKDAADFCYLIQSYSKIPEIFDALHEEGYMEAQKWDESKASAMKLGKDVAVIALPETIKFLKDELFSNPDKTEQFTRDMHGGSGASLARYAERFDVFVETFLG